MKKNKYDYYLAKNDYIVDLYNLDYTLSDLKNFKFMFYTEVGFDTVSDGIIGNTYKQNKLSNLLYDYIIESSLLSEEEDMIEAFTNRLNILLFDKFILRYDKKTKIFNIVNNNEIVNCYIQVLNNLDNGE